VLLVAGGDQDRVQVQEEVVHPGDARLHRSQEVLVVLQGPLEQIGELDHSAIAGDQRGEIQTDAELLELHRNRDVSARPLRDRNRKLTAGEKAGFLAIDRDQIRFRQDFQQIFLL